MDPSELPSYRLRPAPGSGLDVQRWVGTRPADGARVHVVLAPGAPVASRSPYVGVEVPDLLTLTVTEPVSDGLALVYADPPAHGLADLVEVCGAPTGPQIVGILAGIARVLQALADLGLAHPGITVDGLGVRTDGTVVCGDLGLVVPGDPGCPPDAVDAEHGAALIRLARDLLGDQNDVDPGVARLGLDPVDATRRALAEALATLGDAAGMPRPGLAEVAQTLLAAGPAEDLKVPAAWARLDGDLAARLRALATPIEGEEPRWARASIRIPRPTRTPTRTPARAPVRAAGASPAPRRGADAGRRADAGRGAAGGTVRRMARGPARGGGSQASGRRHRAERVAGGRRPRGGSRTLAQRAADGWGWLSARPVRYVPVLLLAALFGFVIVAPLLRSADPATAGPVAPAAAPAANSAPASRAPGSQPEPEPMPADPSASADPSAPTDPSAPAPEASSAAPAIPGHRPIADPTGPLTDPRAVAGELSRLRTRAWLDLDTEVLTVLDAPRSAALRADSAALARARADRVRYVGLEFTVRSARGRAAGASADRVVLDAVVDTSAFTVTGPDGHTTRVPAQRGSALRLHLAWSGSRWQVRDVG